MIRRSWSSFSQADHEKSAGIGRFSLEGLFTAPEAVAGHEVGKAHFAVGIAAVEVAVPDERRAIFRRKRLFRGAGPLDFGGRAIGGEFDQQGFFNDAADKNVITTHPWSHDGHAISGTERDRPEHLSGGSVEAAERFRVPDDEDVAAAAVDDHWRGVPRILGRERPPDFGACLFVKGDHGRPLPAGQAIKQISVNDRMVRVPPERSLHLLVFFLQFFFPHQ